MGYAKLCMSMRFGQRSLFGYLRALSKWARATQIARFGNDPGDQADGFVVDQIESSLKSLSRAAAGFL